jgi:hypothetical protein
LIGGSRGVRTMRAGPGHPRWTPNTPNGAVDGYVCPRDLASVGWRDVRVRAQSGLPPGGKPHRSSCLARMVGIVRPAAFTSGPRDRDARDRSEWGSAEHRTRFAFAAGGAWTSPLVDRSTSSPIDTAPAERIEAAWGIPPMSTCRRVDESTGRFVDMGTILARRSKAYSQEPHSHLRGNRVWTRP